MADVVNTNEFKNGMHIRVEGGIWRIVEHQHHKPGKGGAVMRTKLKNVESGSVVDKTFRAGEKFERIRTETNNAQYLYADGDSFVFMDPETFDQVSLSEDLVGDAGGYLKEGMTIQLLLIDGEPRGVQLPTTMEMTVVETEPAVRGDTVGNVLKPATMDTGITINVPAFVTEGDVLKVDTRDGSYISRV